MQTHVVLECKGDIAYLTFSCDQPEKPPTIDYVVLDELEQRLTVISSVAANLRVVIVQSDSPTYFIVGANIRALQTLDAATIVPWIERGHAVFNHLEAIPIPVVARVEGYALGGGLELAMACDLIIASRTATFGQPEARLGLVAGWGGTYRLPRRVGMAKAKEMLFTGKALDAETAYALGLVAFVGDEAEVQAYLDAFIADLRSCSWLAVAKMKELVNGSLAKSLGQACHSEAAASRACLASEDTKARIAAYLERRKV